MNTIEKLGFDKWFKDKADLSKTADLKTASIISAKTPKGLGGLPGKAIGETGWL